MTRFEPVPSSPNCVSSRAEPSDGTHYVEPLKGTDLAAVKALLEGWERTDLVEEHDGYAHYTCKTKWIGFTDDLELEQEGEVVHVRSASRLGYGDFGVNRKRIERLRAELGAR